MFATKNEDGDNCLHHLVASNKDIRPKYWNKFSKSQSSRVDTE